MSSSLHRLRHLGRLRLPAGCSVSLPNLTAASVIPPAPAALRTPPGVRRSMATTRSSGAYLEEPGKPARFGLLKVFVTVITGMSIGAWISKKLAAFLEENELFVPEDDDDDDDDDD